MVNCTLLVCLHGLKSILQLKKNVFVTFETTKVKNYFQTICPEKIIKFHLLENMPEQQFSGSRSCHHFHVLHYFLYLKLIELKIVMTIS